MKHIAKHNVLVLIIGVSIGALLSVGAVFAEKNLGNDTPAVAIPDGNNLQLVQGNSVKAVSNPSDPLLPGRTVKMTVTGYSSTPEQTDSTPFITASGKNVRDGIVANNMLPFGSLVRIPELYGEKVFVVEDRMHSRMGSYRLDIWFPDYWSAKSFGAQHTYIEILEG